MSATPGAEDGVRAIDREVMALTVAVKRGIHARLRATMAESDDETDEWLSDYSSETAIVVALQRSISARLAATEEHADDE